MKPPLCFLGAAVWFGVSVWLLGCDRRADEPNNTPKAEKKTHDPAKSVLDKAVLAHGGKEAIERLRLAQVTYKIQGEFPFLPAMKNLDIIVKETYQLPDRIKKEIRGNAGGKEMDLVWATGPERFWYRDMGNKAQFVNKPTDVEGQMRPFMVLGDLARHEVFKWTVVDDPTVTRPAMDAIKDESGRICYFDQTSGVLTGTSARQFIRVLGKEALMESQFSDYKVIDGLKIHHKAIGFQDGKSTSEITILEVRLLEKLDDRFFDPDR